MEAARSLSNNLFKIHKKYSYLTKCFVKSCSQEISIETQLFKCRDCNYYYCVYCGA